VNEPCCYDCLSKDAAVKVIDLNGFEHWFCAEDWQSHQEFKAKLDAMLASAMAAFAP